MSARRDATSDAGNWLFLGGALLAVVLPLHGPIHADLSDQMQHIAEGHGRWISVHWLAAIALILLTGSGLMFFLDAKAGRRDEPLAGAWLLLSLGAMVTIGTAVAEATAVSHAAAAGDSDAFVTWWQFASGLGNGFFIAALAVAAIAWSAGARQEPPMPALVCRIAALVALLSAAGWSLGQHFGLPFGGPLWFVSTLLTALWLAWLGICSRAKA